MSLRHSPASIRSFKAKLRTLFKPSIWASTVGVSLMLVLGWQSVNALKNRENAATDRESVPESPELAETLSPEESQIAADIESSDVLRELLREQVQPIATSIPNIQSNGDEPQGLFDRVTAEGLDTADVLGRFSVGNPSTTTQTQNPIADIPLQSWNSDETSLNTGDSQSERANPYTSPVLPNVLQSALEQASTNSPTAGSTDSFEATQPQNPAVVSPNTPPAVPSVAQRWDQQFINSGQTQPILPVGVQPGFSQQTSVPVSPYSTRSGSNLTDLKRSSSVFPTPTQPNATAYPGGTGNLPTATPVVPGSYNYETFNNFSGTTAQPTVPYADPYQTNAPNNSPYSSQYQFEQQQPVPPSSALETSIPGRYIGGGEINTFANP
ncbi:hypothetical protein IQ235_00805 [Oscillatoriales cyanobacterium LEGE 11467]|uniref:Uncharacterized protein n=1 Tax=Zarconia navalis LEGE 11467 TaxID=1828826 RepID=A0A928VS20_9CYAN|nr:hypothetical protein [Zarconia navalis]MBE9039334.1 hypothetical protein [Zarconia navalis LEGE 11467]